MGVLILTGPSAGGKNTIAAATARLLDRCAVVDADEVRYMAVRPHKVPAAVASEWGHEDEVDWRLGVRAASALAKTFSDAGFDVLLLDVLTEASLSLYRAELSSALQVVLLLPSYAEVQRRHRERGPEPHGSFMRGQPLAGGWRLSESDLERLYRQQESFSSYNVRIDNTEMSADAVARRLAALMTAAREGHAAT